MRAAVLGLVIVLSPFAAQAQAQSQPGRTQPAQACSQTDAVLPAPFSAWISKAAAISAVRAGDLGAAQLAVGGAYAVVLHPTSDVAYAARPEKPGGSVSHGGLLTFQVDRPGAYAVALDSGAWIDVIKGKAAVESIAHRHGPECSSIHKVVDFKLSPGRYVLQVSANAGPEIAVMVTQRP